MTHLRCPDDLCYWAILDASMPRPGELPTGLALLAEEQIPVSLDELFLIGAPIGPNRVIACARRRADLEAVDPAARSLAPARVPPPLGVDVDAGVLNFLVGPFEPRASRRARFRAHAGIAACVLVSAAFVAIGLFRRERHWTRVARDAERAAAELVRRANAPADPAALDAALADLEPIALASASITPAADAAAALESVLLAWPESSIAVPLSISVSAEGATIAATLEGDPADFLARFSAPPGWTLDEPRLLATDRLMRMSLTLRPPTPSRSTP